MKYLAALMILMFMFGCGEPQQLPAGYRVLCSVDGKKYALMMPSGRPSAAVWNSEKDAIDFSIYWETVKDEPYVADSEKYTWGECNSAEDKP